ncbi:MAG: stage sporulation protein [Bacilli bacterium]|nr:stage sporulation protein [Bacilli bacterium]
MTRIQPHPPHPAWEQTVEQVRNGQLALNDALKKLYTPESAAVFPVSKQDQNRIEAALAELQAMIGLKQIKTLVDEIHAYLTIQEKRRFAKLTAEPVVLHMIFRGNPGTGKTTVARLLAKLFRELNVLSKGHLVEVERADLVGEYIGHTAQKTRDQVKKAMGGILFIDEAYSLSRGGEKDFGKEAIDTLVKSMEDYKTDFILILAGYGAEMDYFLSTNPGLPSRFAISVTFDDYTEDELLMIAKQMASGREYQFTFEAELKLREFLRSIPVLHSRSFSNARLIRNLIEKSIRLQAVRLVRKKTVTREELMTLLPDDLALTEEFL